MNQVASLTGFKYAYLAVFFALLAGFFYPLVTGTGFDGLMYGMMVLFVGLGGGVLLYRSATRESKKMIFFGVGFALIAISLYFVIQLTGRV